MKMKRSIQPLNNSNLIPRHNLSELVKATNVVLHMPVCLTTTENKDKEAHKIKVVVIVMIMVM